MKNPKPKHLNLNKPNYSSKKKFLDLPTSINITQKKARKRAGVAEGYRRRTADPWTRVRIPPPAPYVFSSQKNNPTPIKDRLHVAQHPKFLILRTSRK